MSDDKNPFIEHPAKFNARGNGEQWLFKFPNGYGASVVRTTYSYGGNSGLWELAVLDSTGELDYSTPITSDVLGWQSEDDVRKVLARVAGLPSDEAAS